MTYDPDRPRSGDERSG